MGALTTALAMLAPSVTETAVANGDTRTINLFYVHTGESISATYLVNGQYDSAVLQQLNWFLRDWRRSEPTNMDPRLFDVIWEAYRNAGAGNEVVTVVSAYRSPQTNAMLRSRSRAVARYSQHMLGKAMDTTMPGMPMSRIREIGMRMQRGGVGYYPTAGTPFVHLDVGSVRAWPRMSYDQLTRLFPDGKTVHLPSNGQPLARYEEAKAEIEARNNGAVVVAPRKTTGGFFAFLFGGGEDEGEDAAPAPAPSTRKQWADLAPRNSRAARTAAAESDEEGGGEAPTPAQTRRSAALARAQANLPRGETVMTAAPDAATPTAAVEPPAREKAGVAVNAPRPPQRPASMDKPTPLELAAPAESRVAVASVEPENPAKLLRGDLSGAASETANESDARSRINAPEPPRRPRELASRENAPLPPARPAEIASVPPESPATAPSGVVDAPRPPARPLAMAPPAVATSAPLPPARPKTLAAGDRARADNALANLIDVAGTADKRGGTPPTTPRGKTRENDQDALAYAPPAPARADPAAPTKPAAKAAASKTGFVPARLDHSNFQAMTQSAPSSKLPTNSVMGASIGAVRSAARATEPSMLTSGGGVPTRFSSQGAVPVTDKFVGK